MMIAEVLRRAFGRPPAAPEDEALRRLEEAFDREADRLRRATAEHCARMDGLIDSIVPGGDTE